MSATKYYEKITGLLAHIHERQAANFEKAGEALATAIAAGRRAASWGSCRCTIRG